jgi:arylsulfatase A-like enzyme
MTAFDSDIRVPLIVVGPDVPPGTQIDELAENIDLAPTFMRLAGETPPPDVDGHSLVALLRGEHPRPWRSAVLIEHHHPPTPEGDPDSQTFFSGNPPSYQALRTRIGTYVEYDDGEREWYDLRNDPAQLDNEYDWLTFDERVRMENLLEQLSACWGSGCWRASLR